MKLSENAWEDEKDCRKGSLSPFVFVVFNTRNASLVGDYLRKVN